MFNSYIIYATAFVDRVVGACFYLIFHFAALAAPSNSLENS